MSYTRVVARARSRTFKTVPAERTELRERARASLLSRRDYTLLYALLRAIAATDKCTDVPITLNPRERVHELQRLFHSIMASGDSYLTLSLGPFIVER